MKIDHANHDHPKTPAARAACRKARAAFLAAQNGPLRVTADGKVREVIHQGDRIWISELTGKNAPVQLDHRVFFEGRWVRLETLPIEFI